MRKLIIALAAMACIGATVSLSACQTVTALISPSEIGCSKEEANECRYLIAASFIENSNTTIKEALQSGAITATEASRLRAITLQGEQALALAKEALPLENATTVDRLAAVNAIVLRLLREQLIKASA